MREGGGRERERRLRERERERERERGRGGGGGREPERMGFPEQGPVYLSCPLQMAKRSSSTTCRNQIDICQHIQPRFDGLSTENWVICEFCVVNLILIQIHLQMGRVHSEAQGECVISSKKHGRFRVLCMVSVSSTVPS